MISIAGVPLSFAIVGAARQLRSASMRTLIGGGVLGRGLTIAFMYWCRARGRPSATGRSRRETRCADANVHRPGVDSSRMEYTHVGRLGLVVSRLCLGTMNFGPHASEPDSHTIMDAAIANGINFFDTANVYGRHLGVGATEEIIGRLDR